jgi:hypothetical protein
MFTELRHLSADGTKKLLTFRLVGVSHKRSSFPAKYRRSDFKLFTERVAHVEEVFGDRDFTVV